MSTDSASAQQLHQQSSGVSNSTPIVPAQQAQPSSQDQDQQLQQQQSLQPQHTSSTPTPQTQTQPQHHQHLLLQQVQQHPYQQVQPGLMPYQQQQQQQQQQYAMGYGNTQPQQQANGQTSSGAATARPYLGYPDQYQQYLQSVQQMGAANSSALQPAGAGVPVSTANGYQANPYSYYMMNQQAATSGSPIPPQQLQPQSQPLSQQADYSSYAYRGYMQGYPPAMYPSGVGSVPSIQPQQPYISGLNSTVGQIQPAGLRPRITTTMWEDEKTLCYQVDANGISVVRRADNNMINGTKLLNVAKMTRGRRDGILKSEKVRKVVKIGSMHLKGVWIPFERALAMAQREGIVDLLYPLFVKDIKRVIQQGTPTNAVNGNSSSSSISNTAGGGASNGGSISSAPVHQQQQQPQPQQPSSASSSAIPTSGLANSYSNLYYSNQIGSATSSDKLDSKDSRPQQLQPYGYYQQQQPQPPQQLQQLQQPYYYYPTQMQQPYGGAYGYATLASSNPSVPTIGAVQDGQAKIEPK